MLILRSVSSCNACKCCFQILHHLYFSTATLTNDSYAKYMSDSFGFSRQQALSISSKLYLQRTNKVYDSEFSENANSVVTLFRNLGFHETHIRIIVSRVPRLLAFNVEQTLKPKIRALQNEDLSPSEIIRVISRHPIILLYGLESTIEPVFHILRQVMGSHSNVVNTIERLNDRYLRNMAKYLLPNVALLSSYGVPIELIRRQLLHQPGYFVRNPKVFKDIVMRADKKLEITGCTPMNLCDTNLISGLKEDSFESKCRMFKSFGWTQSDVETFIFNHLSFLTFSDEYCKKKLDFLMNKLRLKPAHLISRNNFIICSLEKRILPRHKILLILKEKGLFKKNLSTYRAIRMSAPCFLKKYVRPFKEVHKAYVKLTGCSLKMQTQESSTSTTDSYAKYMMDSLGFSRQQALSISTNLTVRRKNKVIDSKFTDNASSVVTLFHCLGFDDTLLRHVVSKEPRLLASNVEKTLKPKIRALQDAGFSLPDIIRVISWRPTVLCLGSESTILPAVQILKEVMGSVSNVVNIIERLRKWHFHAISGCLLPNVTLLTSYGVPIELIRKHMLHQPGYYVQNPQVFKDVVMRVETKLGITRDSPMFLYGINLFSGMSEETFESKCRMFKSFGWTQSDLETLIIKNAYCFTSSEETIKRKLNFLMTELQLKPAYLKSRTGFITRSLEKTIVPRHTILMILKEKGLLKTTPSLYSAIYRSEPCFFKRFVLPFKEVHQDYAKLIGLKMQTQKSSASIS